MKQCKIFALKFAIPHTCILPCREIFVSSLVILNGEVYCTDIFAAFFQDGHTIVVGN